MSALGNVSGAQGGARSGQQVMSKSAMQHSVRNLSRLGRRVRWDEVKRERDERQVLDNYQPLATPGFLIATVECVYSTYLHLISTL